MSTILTNSTSQHVSLPSVLNDLVEIALNPSSNDPLHRDLADVLAEPHWHQDVQEWSGDLDDSRAHLIDQVEIDLVLR